MVCEVANNCLNENQWQCEDCFKFNYYFPRDPSVKSPRQLEKKAEKQAAKSELKQSDKSKMGKRNKRCGSADERQLVKVFKKYGFEAERMPLSGALGKKYANDIHLILSPEFKLQIENKRRKSHSTLYKLSVNNSLIEGFGYVLCEKTFMELCRGKEPICSNTVKDKGFATLKKWFTQDAADIVSVHEVYKEYVFVVPIPILQKLIKRQEGEV